MNWMPRVIGAAAVGLCLSAGELVHAQSGGGFEITSFTIDGGGGPVSGGGFTLNGTAGQFDATSAPLEGGMFRLEGGFWPTVLDLPLPEGPVLRVRYEAARVFISWPASLTGFQLETCTVLPAAPWADVGTAPVLNGDRWEVAVSPGEAARFFRLRKP